MLSLFVSLVVLLAEPVGCCPCVLAGCSPVSEQVSMPAVHQVCDLFRACEYASW